MDLMKYYKIIYKYRRWTAGLLATGLGLNKGLSHIFPVNLYMPFNASLDCDNIPLDHQIWLIRNTKSDLGMNEDIFPFVTNSPDACCAGFFAFSKWKQSSVIGLPKNFFCSNIYELEDLKIEIGNGKFLESSRSPNELALLESLLFSEDAQKFAVARLLYSLKDNWAILQTLLSPLFVAIGYFACFHGVKLLFSQTKSVSLVNIIRWNIICIFVTWLLCKLARSTLNHIMIYSTDKKAAMVSKEYAKGGIEYCERVRSSNKAIRILLGKKGERMFTVYGNEIDGMFINWNGPSLTERQKRLEQISNTF